MKDEQIKEFKNYKEAVEPKLLKNILVKKSPFLFTTTRKSSNIVNRKSAGPISKPDMTIEAVIDFFSENSENGISKQIISLLENLQSGEEYKMVHGISILIVRIAGTQGRAFECFKSHFNLKEITLDDTSHRYATIGPSFSIYELTVCQVSVDDHKDQLKILHRFLKQAAENV